MNTLKNIIRARKISEQPKKNYEQHANHSHISDVFNLIRNVIQKGIAIGFGLMAKI